MQYTTYFNLKIPDITDLRSIIDLNDNAFIIDNELQENKHDIEDLNTLAINNNNTLQGLIDDIELLLANSYAVLTGKTGGQTLEGGIAASENLTLSSTHHGTKGNIIIGTSKYDELNNRLGIGKTPSESIDSIGNIKGVEIQSSQGSKLANGLIYNKLVMDTNITIVANEVAMINIPMGKVFDTNNYNLVIEEGGFLIVNQEK